MQKALHFSFVQAQEKSATIGNGDLTVVLLACAIGLAISLACFALPGWSFQPTDALAFPLT
jgi:hypothetical protein